MRRTFRPASRRISPGATRDHAAHAPAATATAAPTNRTTCRRDRRLCTECGALRSALVVIRRLASEWIRRESTKETLRYARRTLQNVILALMRAMRGARISLSWLRALDVTSVVRNIAVLALNALKTSAATVSRRLPPRLRFLASRRSRSHTLG